MYIDPLTSINIKIAKQKLIKPANKFLKEHRKSIQALECVYPSYILSIASTKYGVGPAEVKSNFKAFGIGITNIKDIVKRTLTKRKR